MTKQEFLSELERALGKLPHTEVEQALAFYDEAVSDRMEDGLSEAEAVADLGPIDEIAAQIAAETPPIPRAIARANTGSRTLNIVLLAVFSPIWLPIVLALAAAALAVYVAIWAVIAALWAVDATLVLMPFAGLAALVSTLGGGMPLPGVFVFGLSLVSSGFGLVASFAVFWASKLLFQATRTFARWIASLFVRVSGGEGDRSERGNGGGSSASADGRTPVDPTLENDRTPAVLMPADTKTPIDPALPEGGTRNA